MPTIPTTKLPIPSAEDVNKYTSSALPTPTEDERTQYITTDLPTPTADEARDYTSGATSNRIQDTDIATIAARNGVDPAWLDDQISILGGRREQMRPGEPVQYALSIADEAALLGAGKWIYKKLQGDESKRKAIDDLTTLIQEKKPWQQTAVEIVGGLAVPTGVAGLATKGWKGAAKAGAIIGGAAGLTHSQEGEELSGTAMGAGLGAVGGAALHGAGTAISKLPALTRRARNVVGSTLAGIREDLQDDIISRGTEVIDRNPEVNEFITDTLTNRIPESFDQFMITPQQQAQFLKSEGITTTEQLMSKYNKLSNKYGDRMTAVEPSEDLSDTTNRYIYMRLHQLADKWASAAGARLEGDMTGMQYLTKRVATEGPEFVSESLRNYRVGEAGRRLIRESIPTNSETGGLIRRVGLFLMDAPKVADVIDTRYGTAVRSIIDDLSAGYNKFTNRIASVYDSIRTKDLPILSRVGADRVTQITREIDSKPIDWVTHTYIPSLADDAERDVVRTLMSRGKQLRDDAIADGLPITQLQRGGERLVYIPNAMLDTPELIATIRSSIDDIVDTKYGRNLGKFLSTARINRAELVTPESQLLRAIEITTGRGADGGITDVKQLGEAISTLRSDPSRVRANLESMAAASHYRAGTIPEFIREYNPVKLFTRWAHNTNKHIFLRRGLDALRNQIRHLERLGDEQGATWVRNLLLDIQGTRQGTARATMNNIRLKSQLNSIEKLKQLEASDASPIEKSIGSALIRGKARMWDIWPALTGNMYPYYLGFRVDAVLRNITQPYQLTAAVIGSDVNRSYGLKKIAQAQLLNKLKPDIDELSRQGLIPANYHNMAVDELNGELERALSKKGWTAEAIKKAQDVSMFLYTWSDNINRSVTNTASRLVADDFIRGLADIRSGSAISADGRAAIAAMRKLPRSYQSRLKQMMRDDNYTELPDMYAQFLNSDTQFNYNRISMSEFGRTMGSLFSMFSKWPSAILGDIVQQISNKRSGNRYRMKDADAEILHKYLYPLMGAVALDQFILPSADESPTRRLLAGKSMYQWTNASSVSGLLNGQFGKPPALAALIDATQAAVSGDPRKAGRDIIKYGESITPVSSLLQLIPQRRIMNINETRMDQLLDAIQN